ncbi:hypothetical protein BCT30_08005 [Enterovibrio norvegicus]|uniref:hypothetical protein n=1 Tax=Enterovibrio norvegicus TaxID=188144 RepID=UPI000C81E7CF|nr:hypothetical protein [Enterovibrio norvegicus]MCC4796969.1 hypothetical protein [Enterovibrio norvegicus]PMI34350.1 hypothetical protein BCU47_06645 [Enterovibrio norvegicus]PMI40707.1 hypothetical protein BCU46_04720 [Enterovibrio norvegicus]PMN56387.1 hypothetical protein BCT30_08005 [Enterovibrio norvegicus]TKF09321.1 hypothetical protein FCV66_21740 [Enterovibrio norvegicus]
MDNRQLGIKIDYSREKENPARVFHAMGELLDGINEIQQAVIDASGLELRLSSKLSRTIEGSVVAVQNNSVTSPSGKVIETGNFLSRIQTKIINFLGSPAEHSSKEPLQKLASEMIKDVHETFQDNEHVLEGLNIHHIDDYRVSKGVEKTLNAINKKLTDQDKVYMGLGADSSSPSVRIGDGVKLKVSVEDMYKSSREFPHKKLALQIANAAFSGDIWRFSWLCKVSGRKEFSAKISHTEWLEKWLNRQVHILPGDGLRVDLKVLMGENGKRISHEIEHVYGPIPRTEMIQLQMAD